MIRRATHLVRAFFAALLVAAVAVPYATPVICGPDHHRAAMTPVGATAIGGTSHDHQGPACTHIDGCAVSHVAAVLSGDILVLDVPTNAATRTLIPVLWNQLLLRIDTPPPRV